MLTLIVAITAIFSAQRAYASAKLREFGIMIAIGASRQRLRLQLVTEVSLAALLSAALTYLLSGAVVRFISTAAFGVGFEANTALIAASTAIPFLASLSALLFVNRSLDRNVAEILR